MVARVVTVVARVVTVVARVVTVVVSVVVSRKVSVLTVKEAGFHQKCQKCQNQ